MASSTLQKLLRSQTRPASTILTRFHKPLPPSPLSALTHIPKPNDPIPDRPETNCFNPKHSFSGHVYPSFSFEFFLNSVAPAPLIRPESDCEADEDTDNVIRADSVKKKRKKKMNKHKLKKQRKRLRRKTKS